MRDSKGGPLGGDRRKNNVTPKHSRIQTGEVRNPWGAGGKPRADPPSEIDKIFQKELSRIVSYDSDGPVDAKTRLVQEELHGALTDSSGALRQRVLLHADEVLSKIERQEREGLAYIIERKRQLTERVDRARESGSLAPDILPHPDHVHLRNGWVHFNGPSDMRGRKAWEMLKAAIRVAACLHAIDRAEVQRTNCPVAKASLKQIERHRRWLMRQVPRDWNWREEIYCRDSMLVFANDTVKRLKEIGYVAPDAID